MVQEVDLVIDKNSIEVSPKSGSILSTVYFRINDKTFPDEGWSDFAVVILGWWIEELSKLEGRNKVKTFKLNFMDGPLFVKGFLKDVNLVELEFAKERLNRDEVFFNATCAVEQLKIAIHKAARELVKELDKKGLDNNDVRKLKILTAKKG